MQRISDDQLQRAYRYAMSLTNDHDVAMDIVHTAYVSILGRGASDIKNIQGYFLRCVRNTFIDQKRFDDRWLIAVEDPEDNGMDISLVTLESTIISQDLLVQLWKSFKPLERELLYLWAVEEYTIDEISHLTETSRGTLLSRIHRIRKKVLNNNMSKEAIYEQAN